MELISQLVPGFIAGASGSALFWMWRKSAARWGNWFPLLKKALECLLWLWAIGTAFGLVYALATAEDLKLAAMGAMLGFAIPAVRSFLKRSGNADDEVKRGTNLATAAEVTKFIKASKKRTRLKIGNVPIPYDAEPYHLLIAGATGTGKSVAINEVLDQLRAANDTVILVDSGGDFMSKHFHAGQDFVFNPFDDRCVNWSPVLEMQGEWDAEALARSIVPDGVGDNKEWNGYAQTLVGSVLRQLWSRGQMTLRDFLYYVQAASTKELQELLKGTAAAAQLSSEKTFGSIRTIASNYLTAYSYLPNQGDPFSVSAMIRAEHSGFLFVTYRDDQLDSLRSLIACILDVAARSILSMPPDPNRRIWLVLDEFASIGRVQSIEAVATKARKAGGCLLLGVQAVSQLRDRYGEYGAQTILSCLSSWLVLRCTDADTAEYMSKYIGDSELFRQQKSNSVSESGETSSRNDQLLTQRALLPSQIQGLPNLQGYLKLAGSYPICGVTLQVPDQQRKTVAAAFDARDFTRKPMLKLLPSDAASETPAVPSTAQSQVAPPSAPPSGGPVDSAAKPPAKNLADLAIATQAVRATEPVTESRVLVTRSGTVVRRPSLLTLRAVRNPTNLEH
jgi:type IV secretory pathway TraG/TraD family ATPase VirD4